MNDVNLKTIETHKRIVQNLKDVTFDDDSDEDTEYDPIADRIEEDDDEQDLVEEELYSCTTCDFQTKYEKKFKKAQSKEAQG